MLTERLFADHEGDAHLDPSLYEKFPGKIKAEKKKVASPEEEKSVPFTQRPDIQKLNAKIEEQKKREQ
ncbi:MAG: hypothetical protein KW802_00425 [Candidatus Doudnabacteria bacterium]|nr:hypothetical protein [Candidatus Doudnabacteria bacterium]